MISWCLRPVKTFKLFVFDQELKDQNHHKLFLLHFIYTAFFYFVSTFLYTLT